MTDAEFEELLRVAQAQPGIADLAELSALASEAAALNDLVRESEVVFMLSAATTSTADTGHHAYLGRANTRAE